MSKYTHKDKKYARTRLSLLDALTELIGTKPFEEVKLTEICEKACVSYATFFNYFSRKEDLLTYFIQLWSIEVSHTANKISKNSSGLRTIEEIFTFTARQCEKGPEIMTEIISFQAKQNRKCWKNFKPLTDAEKFNRFPHIEDFSGLNEEGLESIFPPLLRQAVKNGELPITTDINALVYILASIFLGVPVALGPDAYNQYEIYYTQSLKITWAGLQKQGEEHETGKRKIASRKHTSKSGKQ